MDEKIEVLKQFDNDKLIDIVKNYRQYGYDDDLRMATVQLLIERGINVENLMNEGKLENKNYDEAKKHFRAFEMYALIAFIAYCTITILQILASSSGGGAIVMIFSPIYLFLFYKTYKSQEKYYKLIGKEEKQLDIGSFFTLGLLLYGFMYFSYRKQIKEDINFIR